MLAPTEIEPVGAVKNLEWSYVISPRLSVFDGVKIQGYLDPFFVVPTDVGVDHLDELLGGGVLPVSG